MVITGRGAALGISAAGLLLLPLVVLSQGVSSGNVSALRKPKFSGQPFSASFADVAAQAGLTMRFVNGRPDQKNYIIEATGTGVAFVDVDNDGFQDVFLVNSSTFERSRLKPMNHLYRNTGTGKFVDITERSGVGRSGWGNGVCVGDWDNDGNTDLYVTYWGANSLFRNTGRGMFEDVAARAGVAGPTAEWSTGCSFFDYDRDGRLDLLVASYVGFDRSKTPLPGEFAYCLFRDVPVYCGPRGLPHGTLTLYHNRGDGTFEDISARSGLRETTPCYAFTSVAFDLDGDGWQDVYVACDSTPSLYFRNNRNGTFAELGTEAGIAYNEHGTEQAGMGVAVADFDNDGWPDITKSNFTRDFPNLYRNLGKGRFEDIVLAAGLAVNPQHVLWGVGLEDFDNDGLRDIFQVSGHVYTNIPSEPWAGPSLLYRNLGSRKFEDVSHLAGPALQAKHSSRGAAFSDYDNDGDIDILVMNMDEPPSLLRNDGKSDDHWVSLRLVGSVSNRAAIGASVTVHAAGIARTAPVLSQSSYLSSNDLRVHLGLGKATEIEHLVVRWPSGDSETFNGVKVDSFAVLTEGQGAR